MYKSIMLKPLFVLALCTLTACEAWFDESPKTDLKASRLFESEEGFQSALTGVYLQLTSSSAYGGTMSFGLLDQLAQQYDYLPDGAQSPEAIYDYANYSSAGFNTKRRIDEAWKSLYKAIANSNNLLRWLGARGETVIGDATTRKMMRGEALAVRAFCHFDLLRAWGPAHYRGEASAPKALTIPYRTAADNSKQPRLEAQAVVERVVADLLAARELLAFEQRLKLTNSERRYRFNYHAVNALLARVYAYVGDAEKASAYAQQVIDESGLQLQTTNQNDPILFNECLVGLNLYEMDKALSSHWAAGEKFTTQLVVRQEKFGTLFEVQGTRRDDIRSKTAAFYNYDAVQLSLSRKYTSNTHAIIPLVRLPEMYYILCEMSSDYPQAARYLNLVRNRRGYSASLNERFTTDEQRLLALDREWRKEFYAEGQYWYFLKQHGYTSIPYATHIALDKARYEWPLPDAEIQYGWAEASETPTTK